MSIETRIPQGEIDWSAMPTVDENEPIIIQNGCFCHDKLEQLMRDYANDREYIAGE